MILKKTKLNLIEPYDMEYKNVYIARFTSSRSMQSAFNGLSNCRAEAEKVWNQKMAEATVTVTLLNGDQFFIY